MMAPTSAGTRPPRKRRWLRWALLVVLLGGAVTWFTRPRWHGVPVEVVAPTRGTVVETLVSSGRVLAPSRVTIASSIVGLVSRVEAREGDRVARGQVLLQLQDDEARAAVERAEAALAGIEARRADLAKRRGPTARELLTQARASLAQAEADHARNAELARGSALPAAELERSQTALTLARSRLRAAEIEARSARPDGPEDAALDAQEAETKAALEAARARLALHTATSPVDGVVLARDVEPGSVVSPGVPLIVLAEAGRDRLVIEPDEKNLRVLALGQPALASADAFPDRRFAATVSWIAASVDPRRGTVEVHLALASPQDFLKADMTVSVEIEVARKADALTVPRAVVRDLATEAPWVMIVEGEHAKRQPVTLGLRGDEAVEITTGLTADARVVVPSPSLPAEGARVRAREAAGGGG
ncbi:MAG: efflux RND transporter periplasmic adaptor subunit [Deltaproteobacteria bacterium]|nr:efflux RND transporter periplasmic adaptor subunit [Deltaproteobacteria bacterium]